MERICRMKVGDKRNTPCLKWNCPGEINGTYGGRFHIGRVEYTQIMNCKCHHCGDENSEVFECWDESEEEWWLSDVIVIPVDDDEGIDIAFPGLGMPAAEADLSMIFGN